MMSADAVLSKTTGKLWSEIEVSDDEFQVEPEVVHEALRPQPSPLHYNRSTRSTAAMDSYPERPSSSRHQHSSGGRRGGGNSRRREHRMNSSNRSSNRQVLPTPATKTSTPTAASDAPRKRRFANISSLEVLLDWPRQTSSLATQQKEAAAPFSSTESSTSIPSSSIIEESSIPSSTDSAPEDSSHHDDTPLNSTKSAVPPIPLQAPPPTPPSTPTTTSPTPSQPSTTSETSEPPAAAMKHPPEPSDPPFPHKKATDARSRSPAAFEGRMRGWPASNPPSSASEPPSDTECASQTSETARPLEGHMTEEDGDVIFHEPFEIWYTLPSGGARKGINKEVYEGGMHKIGIFTRVSEFFEFHRMLDWNTLPPNSVIAFCREGIRPIWEDPANEMGARYLVKNFSREDTEAIFTKTALGFFSGLFHDWKNYNLVSLHIRDARRGNDIQLWRRTIQSALTAGVVKDDILSITSEERPANLMVSFVPNQESLCRNDERLAYNSSNRKNRCGGRGSGNGRRSPGGSATVESVFGSSAAARSVSSLYSKGKVFSLSAEEKERMIEDCTQEAARINAKFCEKLPSSGHSDSDKGGAESDHQQEEQQEITAVSSPRSELTREAMGEALASGTSVSTAAASPRGQSSSRRREPIPDMIHPAQLMMSSMMGCYYVPAPGPLVVCMVTGAQVADSEEKSSQEEAVVGSPNYVPGYPMYWHPSSNAPMCVVDPQYGAYYPMAGGYGWGVPTMGC